MMKSSSKKSNRLDGLSARGSKGKPVLIPGTRGLVDLNSPPLEHRGIADVIAEQFKTVGAKDGEEITITENMFNGETEIRMNIHEQRAALSKLRRSKDSELLHVAIHEAGHAVAKLVVAGEMGLTLDKAISQIEIASEVIATPGEGACPRELGWKPTTLFVDQVLQRDKYWNRTKHRAAKLWEEDAFTQIWEASIKKDDEICVDCEKDVRWFLRVVGLMMVSKDGDFIPTPRLLNLAAASRIRDHKKVKK
jgi:hypothetical protein